MAGKQYSYTIWLPLLSFRNKYTLRFIFYSQKVLTSVTVSKTRFFFTELNKKTLETTPTYYNFLKTK